MKSRLTKSKKKAIEPIVAAILLIAIAIIAGILLYLWVNKMIVTSSSTSGVSASLQVFGVTYSSGTVDVYIKTPIPLTKYAGSIRCIVYSIDGSLVNATSYVTVTQLGTSGYYADVYKVACGGITLNPGVYYVVVSVDNLGSVTSPSFTVS